MLLFERVVKLYHWRCHFIEHVLVTAGIALGEKMLLSMMHLFTKSMLCFQDVSKAVVCYR